MFRTSTPFLKKKMWNKRIHSLVKVQ